MAETLLGQLVVIFFLSVFVILICNRFKIPPTVGFLLTGVLCGPHLLGIVNNAAVLQHVADVGVAMLLFTIGMELSAETLNKLKLPVFLGGSMQIVLTIVAITIFNVLLGYPLNQCVFWGCLTALSSSAIVLRILQTKGVMKTTEGNLSLAILVFQDIMVAPMLLCVPLLAGTLELTFLGIVDSVLKTIVILGAVLLIAHFWLDKLLEAVMRSKASEILLLTTLSICMGMALLTEYLGLSMSLGAFLAGLMLARSPFSSNVISSIMPYRDVFMSIFFISMGMLLDIEFFGNNLWLVLFGTFAYIVIKAIITLPSVLIQKYSLKTAIIVSLYLAQVGEFAFVLGAQGFSAGLFVSNEDYQQFLAISVLSMMLTPALIAFAPKIGDFFDKKSSKQVPIDEATDIYKDLKNHLIITSFGATGQQLAQVAKEADIPYAIIEQDQEIVNLFKKNELICFGDATQSSMLENLGIAKARAIAILNADKASVRTITHEARILNPDLYIIVSAMSNKEIDVLRRLGADDIIINELEGSIALYSHVLEKYGISKADINGFELQSRMEYYGFSQASPEGEKLIKTL